MRGMHATFVSSVAAMTLAITTNVEAADKPHMEKLGDTLTFISNRSAKSSPAQMGRMGPNNEITLARVNNEGYVQVDAVAKGDSQDLVQALELLGAKNLSSYGRVVSAEIPARQLENMALHDALAFAQPSLSITNAGLVKQEGDRALASDLNRNQLGLNGKGFTIGILSDSFACDPGSLSGGPYTTPDEDVANGDLSADFQVLEEINNLDICVDEGRAMAQLIIDIVPEAKILFHSAANGAASAANGIIRLAEAGADVIVDDFIYFNEPMFQDGIIAQAVDRVHQLGIPYFSSAGNIGSAGYMSEFRPQQDNLGGIEGIWHDWDDSDSIDTLKTITLTGAEQTTISLHWDSPNFSVSGGEGAPNDIDLIAFDMAGNPLPDCFEIFDETGVFPDLCQFYFIDGGQEIDGGAGGDAVELIAIIDFIGGTTVQLGLLNESGNPPGLVQYALIRGGVPDSEYAIDSPTVFGHANARGAEAVGASAFFFTEAFIGNPIAPPLRSQSNEPECKPACLNDFSSRGGIPILFDLDGNRLNKPETRLKPGITAVDGVNTTFFSIDDELDDDNGNGIFERGEAGELPNFFGTSASAPNAAAIAIQMLQAAGTPILETNELGQTLYWMCKPFFGFRSIGWSHQVIDTELQNRLDNGHLLGRCDRPSGQEIYTTMRLTADDITIRAGLDTGETIEVLEGIGPLGFDYGSGFGLLNAPAAVEAIRHRKGFGISLIKEVKGKHLQ